MFFHLTKLTTIFLIFLFLVLTACTPPAVSTMNAPSTATQDIAATAGVLQTQLASTMALQTETAVAAAVQPSSTIAPSSTPTVIPDTPTATATFVLPTAPPTITPTKIYSTLAPRITNTPGPYNCLITTQKLNYGQTIAPGVDFDGKWTVKNTGTRVWKSGGLYAKFESGTKFQEEGNDQIDINKAVKTGEKVDIIIDMVAPKDYGSYHARWALYYGDTYLCDLPVDIRVTP
jgi:hypothetical protein